MDTSQKPNTFTVRFLGSVLGVIVDPSFDGFTTLSDDDLKQGAETGLEGFGFVLVGPDQCLVIFNVGFIDHLDTTVVLDGFFCGCERIR